MRYDHRDWISLLGLCTLAALLLLPELDEPYLWQDEAQTAVISRTILDHGIPYGSDGRNFFSQELGAEYADDHLWRWHTWLSFYAVAASFLAFGETTWAARLPFALFALLTVPLAYAAGRRLWRTREAALCGAALLALSVPWLILGRQCRWYPMAGFFALLGLHAYGRVGADERRFSLLLFAAATALFHTHYFYTAVLLATLLVHSFWLQRDRFRRVFLVSAAVTVTNAPWILWFSDIRYGEVYSGHLSSWLLTWRIGSHLASDLFVYFLSPLFFVIPAGLWARRRLRGAPGLGMSRETVHGIALLAVFCATTVVALAVLSPGAYFRYLGPVAPVAMLLAGGMLGALAVRSRVAAAAFFALWLALSPIRDFVHEITHPFDGPIEGIVRFLEKHARPGDVVAISYGDMPLKFYTPYRVIGGLTGEDLSEAAGAEWIILRRHQFTQVDREVKDALAAHLVPGDYKTYVIPFPDTPFENREDPRFHRYRSAGPSHPRVVVYGKTDEARARDAQRARRSPLPAQGR